MQQLFISKIMSFRPQHLNCVPGQAMVVSYQLQALVESLSTSTRVISHHYYNVKSHVHIFRLDLDFPDTEQIGGSNQPLEHLSVSNTNSDNAMCNCLIQRGMTLEKNV